MDDRRVKDMAELLVGRSLAVEPGWQVLISATPLARPLVEKLVRAVARRGAYPLVRLSFTDLERIPLESIWAEEAPAELLEVPAPSDVRTRNEVDARVVVFSAENVYAGSELAPEKRLALRAAARASLDLEADMNRPWVSCPSPRRRSRRRPGSACGPTRTCSTPPACATGTRRESG